MSNPTDADIDIFLKLTCLEVQMRQYLMKKKQLDSDTLEFQHKRKSYHGHFRTTSFNKVLIVQK